VRQKSRGDFEAIRRAEHDHIQTARRDENLVALVACENESVF
jgi:hypothetical protein